MCVDPVIDFRSTLHAHRCVISDVCSVVCLDMYEVTTVVTSGRFLPWVPDRRRRHRAGGDVGEDGLSVARSATITYAGVALDVSLAGR